jgi:hypothetical protein
VGASTAVASTGEVFAEEASTELVLTEVLPAVGAPSLGAVVVGAVATSPGVVVVGAVAAGDGVHRLSQPAWASASRVRPPGTQVGVGIRLESRLGMGGPRGELCCLERRLHAVASSLDRSEMACCACERLLERF